MRWSVFAGGLARTEPGFVVRRAALAGFASNSSEHTHLARAVLGENERRSFLPGDPVACTIHAVSNRVFRVG